MWERLGNPPTVSLVEWPSYEEELTKDEVVEVVVQVNGKTRGKLQMAAGTPEQELIDQALALERVQHHIDGKTVLKTIAVPDKLVNIVAK